jgi:hypothetical protein
LKNAKNNDFKNLYYHYRYLKTVIVCCICFTLYCLFNIFYLQTGLLPT